MHTTWARRRARLAARIDAAGAERSEHRTAAAGAQRRPLIL